MVFAVGLLIGGSVRENIVEGLGIADLPEARQEVVIVGEKDAPGLLAQLFQRAALISLVPEETGEFTGHVQARIEVLPADWLAGQVPGLIVVGGFKADGVESANVHHVDGHPGTQGPTHHLVQPPAHGARRDESVGKKHQGFAGRKMLQGLEMVAQGGDQPLDARLGSRVLVKGFGSHVLFDAAGVQILRADAVGSLPEGPGEIDSPVSVHDPDHLHVGHDRAAAAVGARQVELPDVEFPNPLPQQLAVAGEGDSDSSRGREDAHLILRPHFLGNELLQRRYDPEKVSGGTGRQVVDEATDEPGALAFPLGCNLPLGGWRPRPAGGCVCPGRPDLRLAGFHLKALNPLALAVLKELEVLDGHVLDRPPCLVGDGDIHQHHVHRDPEGKGRR